jgi:hypothetical protein
MSYKNKDQLIRIDKLVKHKIKVIPEEKTNFYYHFEYNSHIIYCFDKEVNKRGFKIATLSFPTFLKPVTVDSKNRIHSYGEVIKLNGNLTKYSCNHGRLEHYEY